MPRYAFTVNATITLGIDVDAPDLATAVAEAKGASVISLCHQCSGAPKGEWHTTGELDADPTCCDLVDCSGADLDEAVAVWMEV